MVHWTIGELFHKGPGIQGNVEKLWKERWAFPCKLGVYPFHDGQFSDFEPIFEHLIREKINDPWDDRWCTAFLPTAEDLAAQAEATEAEDKEAAIKLYKRANAVYRIARFPYIGTPLKTQTYNSQTALYMKGARLWDVPLEEAIIPHTHAENGDGDKIPLYVRVPPAASKDSPAPVLLLITGLDGHRPDNTERADEFLKRGWATVICDIPGVADCPANRRDPKSPDRLFTAILDWIAAQPVMNSKKVIAWGLSAGGYYAIRLAHTHSDRLIGAIGHGAGTHHYIGREWLEHLDNCEYPFDLKRPYLGKYGYESWEEMLEKCQKEYSLVENGIVDMKSCRLLLLNGSLDGCMPVEDSLLLFDHGPTPKEGRFVPGRFHMGYPETLGFAYPWLESVFATGST